MLDQQIHNESHFLKLPRGIGLILVLMVVFAVISAGWYVVKSKNSLQQQDDTYERNGQQFDSVKEFSQGWIDNFSASGMDGWAYDNNRPLLIEITLENLDQSLADFQVVFNSSDYDPKNLNSNYRFKERLDISQLVKRMNSSEVTVQPGFHLSFAYSHLPKGIWKIKSATYNGKQFNLAKSASLAADTRNIYDYYCDPLITYRNQPRYVSGNLFGTSIYTNSRLGFELTLPIDWNLPSSGDPSPLFTVEGRLKGSQESCQAKFQVVVANEGIEREVQHFSSESGNLTLTQGTMLAVPVEFAGSKLAESEWVVKYYLIFPASGKNFIIMSNTYYQYLNLETFRLLGVESEPYSEGRLHSGHSGWAYDNNQSARVKIEYQNVNDPKIAKIFEFELSEPDYQRYYFEWGYDKPYSKILFSNNFLIIDYLLSKGVRHYNFKPQFDFNLSDFLPKGDYKIISAKFNDHDFILEGESVFGVY